MIKFGYISEINVNEGTVRVFFDDDKIVSNPLPVSVQASKEDKYSFPFAINEHVWCVMDDDCEYGVVAGAIYDTKNKPPNNVSETSIDILIGASKLQLKIDKQAGNLQLTVAGDIIVKANGNVEVESAGDANVKAGGNAGVEAAGNTTVKASNVSVDAPNTTISGNLFVSGNVTAANVTAPVVSAGTLSAGGASISGGNMSISGTVTATDVIAQGKSLADYIHIAPNGPTSPPQ